MKDNDFFTIFIFPFKYELADGSLLTPDDIARNYLIGKSNWSKEEYEIDNAKNYNEFYYFYPFVRQAIFNKKGNTGMEYFRRTDFNYLKVEYYDDKNSINSITTAVKSIDLHLFDNQIGLLTITTEKREDDEETGYHDFLQYNDITRRVYPPYIAENKDNTYTLKKDSKLLPVEIVLSGNNKQPVKEEFNHLNLPDDTPCLSNIIRKLLDEPFEFKKNKEAEDMDKKRVYYTPFTDDRMFIVSYYSDSKLSKELTKECCGRYDYETANDWYRFVFVDGTTDVGIANDTMKRELIQRHTYGRWVKYKTLYGMSRYSFVAICELDKKPRKEFYKKLKQDMKSMYYQIALIVLFQRAMLLKFSEDITVLTGTFKEDKSLKLREDANKLHGNFIKFINKYWFIDVTPQEQGIEIYNQWMGLLNLEKLFSEVQREISQLAEYIENRIESERNRIESERNEKLGKITVYGFPLVVVGLIVSFWQIYEININQFDPWSLSGWKELLFGASLMNSFVFLLIVLVVAVILTILFIRWKFQR